MGNSRIYLQYDDQKYSEYAPDSLGYQILKYLGINSYVNMILTYQKQASRILGYLKIWSKNIRIRISTVLLWWWNFIALHLQDLFLPYYFSGKHSKKLYCYTEFAETLLLPSTNECPRKKCTVFPFHPWDHKDRKVGAVLWVPHSIEELIKVANEHLKPSSGSCILSEHGGEILDVDMISNDEKLYLVSKAQNEWGLRSEQNVLFY